MSFLKKCKLSLTIYYYILILLILIFIRKEIHILHISQNMVIGGNGYQCRDLFCVLMSRSGVCTSKPDRECGGEAN